MFQALYKDETDEKDHILKKFLLEYSCFITLYQFLLYNKVNQLYVYIYPLFFGFPSPLGHHRALEFPVLYGSSHQLSILYIVSIVYIYWEIGIDINSLQLSNQQRKQTDKISFLIQYEAESGKGKNIYIKFNVTKSAQ